MIVDSSALVALVLREPGFEQIADSLATSPRTGIGTPTLAETAVVLDQRLGRDSVGLLLQLREEFEIVEVPFGPDHWREAARAYRHYGRGRHRAQLNFGDCLAYAVAKLANEPLLHTGEDFSKTDLPVA